MPDAKEILSTLTGDIPVIDGMNRAMMIAGKAAGTVAVAIP